MKNLSHTLVTAVLVAIITQTSLAQTPQKKGVKVTSPAKSSITATETHVPQLPAVPPPFAPSFFEPDASYVKYLVNEPKLVYEWVQTIITSTPGKPDQFSTTEDRQKYQSAITERMSVVGPIPIVGRCQTKYDGDRQSFEVKESLHSPKGLSVTNLDPESLNLRTLFLANDNVKKDTYTASNAYGASIEVSRRVSDQYAMIFPGGTNVLSEITTKGGSTSVDVYRYNFYFLTLEAKMSPDVARENEKNIACVYVVTLDSPYTLRYLDKTTPTRTLPFESTTNGFALYGKLSQMIVINKVTGEVYDRAPRAKN